MDLTRIAKINHLADFDDIEEVIVVEDAETGEIVLRNKAYKKHIEAFAGTLPSFDKRFFTIDTIHSVIDGRLCAVEVALPILPVEISFYNHSLRQTISDIENIVRTEVTTDFLTSKNGRNYHDRMLDRIVRRMMKYYESPYAHVFLFGPTREDPGVLSQFALAEPDDATPKISRTILPAYWANSLDNFFGRGFSLLCQNMDGFEPFDPQLALRLKERHIETIVIIPFFAENKMIGLLSLADPKEVGDTTDLFLADFAVNSIGSMVYRGSLYANMYFDDVTGFPWLSTIEYFYERFLQENANIPITICEFDFLHLRMVARTYGPKKRDELLEATSQVLRKKYPKALIARRNGSDDLIIVTTGVAENIAIEANKISEEIHDLYPDIALTLVFGIYQVKDKSEGLEYSLLKTTFAHKYAKEDPFGRIKIFDEKMGERETKNLYYTSRFRQALESGEFEIYIQPKYNLERQQYFGGEALVRWKINGKLIPPDEFIPLFEANGVCRELDLYILKKACDTIARWLKADAKTALPISVNFSRVDFADPGLFEKALFIIKESGIPTDYIEIEITESAYVDYEAQIISFLKKCHAAGIRVLMDDFGSGVSSFSSLKNLSVDVLKLDYKFLSTGGDNAKKRRIIEGIISLARTIGVPVIVEGLETKDEASFFHSLGVRYVQGFLFGKPMPVLDFEKITNREATFQITEITDDRMLYHDILDPGTNANLLFDQLDALQGVFRFDGKTLYPVAINKYLSESISAISPVENFLSSDLFSYLTPRVKAIALSCLSTAREPYVFTAKHKIIFSFGTNKYPLYISTMLIKRDSSTGYEYYLLQGTSAVSGGTGINSFETGDTDLEDMLRSAGQGCVITDEQGYILKFNEFIYAHFPSIEVNKHLTAVFGSEISKALTVKRIYDVASGSVFEVQGKEGKFNGKPAFALIFTALGRPNSYIGEMGGKGFKFYDRMISTISKVALSYVEIDLDEDYFIEVHMNEEHAKLYGSAYQTGSYSKNLYTRLLEAVRSEDVHIIEEKFSFSSLVDAGRAMSPFSVTYKLKGRNEFHRIETKFYYDLGHHYVCFFLEDVTESQIRDFDSLTGCLGRTAGSRIMSNYIANHPLDKMAFVVLDIDRFKELNDTYGHPIGDKILAKVNDAFKRLPSSYIYGTRFGGDEFAILISERGSDFDPDKVKQEIDFVFTDIGHEAGISGELHVSCGIALIPESGGRVETLYPIADGDLYEEKRKKSLKR
ncbi:MAG: EAL domain-containing protein [Bacilli bacterium]|nr:EAL domain-containing protein [Bacilli bacterium]